MEQYAPRRVVPYQKRTVIACKEIRQQTMSFSIANLNNGIQILFGPSSFLFEGLTGNISKSKIPKPATYTNTHALHFVPLSY